MKYQVIMGEEVMVANTVKEVSDMLGKKVTKKQIAEGLVEEVAIMTEEEVVAVEQTTMEETVEEEVNTEEANVVEDTIEETTTVEENIEEVATDNTSKEDVEEEEPTEDDSDSDSNDDNGEGNETIPVAKMSMEEMMALMRKRNEEAKAKKQAKEKEEEIPFEGEYPEIGTFSTENQLKKFYKQLSDDQLDEWLDIEGWSDSVKLCSNASINRMRKCLVIKSKHFPKKSSESKKSKYSKYSTEELLQMALDNDIEVKECNGDARILRMYVIMALRDSNLLD